MRRARATLLVAGVLWLGAAASAAGCPRTSVTAMENEVMCQVCGTTLAVAGDAPEARRERVFIARLAARCASRAQIERALVAEFGPSVLALPPRSGFSLSAYLVPALVPAACAVALAAGALRWRRRRHGRRAVLAGAPTGEDARRLTAELERFGR